MKRTALTLLLASAACLNATARADSHYQSTRTGGEWSARGTWRWNRVPPLDSDQISTYVTAPISVSTGSVTAGSVMLRDPKNSTQLTVGALANLNVANSLSAYSEDSPMQITVEGSALLHRGAYLVGNVHLNVSGGYVYNIARRMVLRQSNGCSPVINITDGGMFYARRFETTEGAMFNITNGEMRVSSISFEGSTTINISHGLFAAAEIEFGHHGRFVLGEAGKLLLDGDVDAHTLSTHYPEIRVSNAERLVTAKELKFTRGTGRFVNYTIISLADST